MNVAELAGAVPHMAAVARLLAGFSELENALPVDRE